jgi:hypothetical protein
MRALFRVVNTARRQAERESGTERLDTLVEQRARLFKMDYPAHARREQGRIVLDDIEANLDQSVEADAIRNDILTLRRQYELDGEAGELIEPYAEFLEALAGLKHSFKRHSERSANAALEVVPAKPRTSKPAGKIRSEPAARAASTGKGRQEMGPRAAKGKAADASNAIA